MSPSQSPRLLRLPGLITAHLRSLMDPADRDDPIRRQFLGSSLEARVAPGESADPLREREIEASPRLLHRYPDRALLLVTNRCAAYCRYCFRGESAGPRGWTIGDRELEAAAAYVAAHTEIRELILSGGDPLVLSGRRLSAILAAFRDSDRYAPCSGEASPGPVRRQTLELRIHTRLPVVAPGRVSGSLVEHLSGAKPLRVVIQVNHPRELGSACLAAVAALQEAGIPVLSQGVLLKGVNDDPRTLVELWLRLADAGVRPHYLFHPDLARGTAHFRVNLERALAVYREAADTAARLRRSGPARGISPARTAPIVPAFALDLPGAGGKVLLGGCRILRESRGFYRVVTPDGRSALYPVDEAGLDVL